jgi:hypothetical protein
MHRFWQTIDQFGKLGASRAAWQTEWGDDYEKWSVFLKARGTVDTIEDPDCPGEILELEKPPTGNFIGFSTATPSHRPPLSISRAMCARLVPDLSALATMLADNLGFCAAEAPRWSDNCFHEIGSYHSGNDNPLPTYLFLPDSRSRHSLILAGLSSMESSILLLPIAAGFDGVVKALAIKNDIHIRVLSTAAGLHHLSIATPPRGNKNKKTRARSPIFTPKKSWEWKDLSIVINRDGLEFSICGEKSERKWAELGMRPIFSGKPNKILQILSQLANGGRLSQRRRDVNERQQISEARSFLKELIPIKDDDPFHKFSDGWGAIFRVDGSNSRQQVKKWEAADPKEEPIRYDTPRSVFDPTEEGFSHR